MNGRDEYTKPAKTRERALESLMMSCARRERAVSDVRRTLLRWRMSPEDSTAIIERLVREGFIDENRYARSYVREKTAAGNWGRYKIEQGLAAKGIPRDIIRQAMEENNDQPDRLGELLTRRCQKEKEKTTDLYALRAKLTRWAVGRGYGYEEVSEHLGRIFAGITDEDE